MRTIGIDGRAHCSVDYRNALNFYIISQSSLGFSIKFQLALSSTRPNPCTSNQSSLNCSSAIRTTLAEL